MKTWLITGVSRGLGLAIARAALGRGDVVYGTTRGNAPDLPGLRVVKLDVSQPSAIEAAVREIGAVDVLVNNAGFGLLGAVEDVTDDELMHVYDVNVFGTIRMTRAVLPLMRDADGGHVINVTSIAGRAPGVGSGVYASAKAAVEGFSAALAQEVAPLGIKVTAVAPGAFRTEFLSEQSIRYSKQPDDAYATTVSKALAAMASMNGKQLGDPDRAAQAFLKLVDAPTAPVHLLLGSDAASRARAKLEAVSREIDAWSSVTQSTDF